MITTQAQVAKSVGVSQQFISLVISGKSRPSWPTAKRLARTTNTDPVLWLEGTAKIFKIKEFVELGEIIHSIYRSSDIIQRRATAEINAHTHARITKTALLGIH